MNRVRFLSFRIRSGRRPSAESPQTLKELDLPSSITSIGDRAFANTSLHQVTMSAGGTVSMGSDVFQGCTELQYVTLNATLRGTCDGLFDGCSALISVSIDDYSYVGADMFRNCSSLASISVPSTVTQIYDRAFYGCSGLESVTLPDTLSTIGFDAFNGCSSLVSVTIPSKAECHLRINNRAFMDCTSLSHVTIVNEIDMIGADVFQGTSLETLSVPSVEYLGDFFGGGTAENPNAGVPDSLTTVSITGNQTAVGAGAFQGCEYLLWVTLPSSVMSIGSQAFSGSGITEIALPRTVRSIAENAFSYCSSVESITVASGNLYYAGTGDCLIRKSDQTLVLGCKNSVIPSSVKVIGENAFRWCSDLTEIEVPSNVTDIDLYAFSNPDLKSISLPYSVKFVSMRLALLESEDLESIHFYGDGVYQIGVADEEEVLLRWRNLTGVYVDDGEAALAYRTDDAWKVYADLIFIKEPSDTCFVLVTDDDSEYFSAEKTIAELYQNEFRAILTLDVTETGELAPTALSTLETQLDALMETDSVMLELYLTRLQPESYQYLLTWCRSSQGEFMDEWTAIYQTAGTVQIISSYDEEREIWGNVYELGRKTAQAYCNSSVDPDENITNMYGFLGYFPIFGNTTLKNDIAFLWGIHTYFEEHTDGVAWGDLVVLTEYQQIAEALSKINETMGVETLWLFVDRDPREFAEVFEEYGIGPEEILLVGSRAFLEQHGKNALLDENYHVFEYAYEYDALFRIVLPFGYYEDPGFLDEVFYSEEFDAFLETYQFQINTWQMFAEYYESFQQGICNRDELIDFYEEQYFFQMMDELQYCENAFLSAEFYDPLI